MKERLRRALPPGGGGPIYKQLADMILAEIEQGLLPPDSSLPTVRELAEEMKLSTGTIKHAYDELAHMGIIEKVRGRGTFVRVRDIGETRGKKDQAMQLLDNLMDEMRELGFSLNEIRIFFDLKMREQEDMSYQAQVMVVDCNPEALHIISAQIARIRGVEVVSRLLDDLPRVAGLQDEELDLIVTTANHYEQVLQFAAWEEQVNRVVLSPSRGTVASLVKAGSGRVGMLTASERFARIIRKARSELIDDAADTPRLQFGSDGIEKFMHTLDTVILPNQYAHFCTTSELAAIQSFLEAGGNVIEFTYHIDAGSLMYLNQRIARVLADKKAKRGSARNAN